MSAEHLTGAALRTAQTAYESARLSGVRGLELRTLYTALITAQDRHIEAARAVSCWSKRAMNEGGLLHIMGEIRSEKSAKGVLKSA